MSSIAKPQSFPDEAKFSSVPDPWDELTEKQVTPYPTIIPLDPGHELTGAPARDAIMPAGVPEALRLSKPSRPIRSAVSILLEEELKLADRLDEPLREELQDAIALLTLVTAT